MRPAICLDVDGVLFPLGKRMGDPIPQVTGYIHGHAGRYPVCWHPRLAGWLRQWNTMADLYWSTSWGEEANDNIVALFDLPRLPVLDIKAGRWQAIRDAFDADRRVVWVDDIATSHRARQLKSARDEYATLVIKPQRDVGLTAAHARKITKWIGPAVQ